MLTCVLHTCSEADATCLPCDTPIPKLTSSSWAPQSLRGDRPSWNSWGWLGRGRQGKAGGQDGTSGPLTSTTHATVAAALLENPELPFPPG